MTAAVPETLGARSLRRFSRNAVALVAGRGAALAGNLAIVFLVAHHLKDAGAGRYGFLAGLSAFLYTVIHFGFNDILIRDLAREPGRLPSLLVNVLAVKALLWAAVAAAAAAAGPWWARQGFLVPVLMIVLFQLFDLVAESLVMVLKSQDRMHFEPLVEGVNQAVAVGGAWWALDRGLGLAGVFAAIAAGGAAAAVVALLATRREVASLRAADAGPAERRRVVAAAVPLFWNNLLLWGACWLDIMVLYALRGERETGWYIAPARVIAGFHWAPILLFHAVYPTLSRAAEADRAGVAEVLRAFLRWMLVLGCGLAALGAVLGGWFVRATLPPEVAAGAAVMPWLCGAEAVLFLSMTARNALIVVREERAAFRATAANAAAVLGLGLAFVPRWGAAGAAAATFGAGLICLALAARDLAARGRLTVFGAWMLKPLACGAGLGAAAWAGARVSPAAGLAAGIAAYAILLVGTGTVSPGEVRAAWAALTGPEEGRGSDAGSAAP